MSAIQTVCMIPLFDIYWPNLYWRMDNPSGQIWRSIFSSSEKETSCINTTMHQYTIASTFPKNIAWPRYEFYFLSLTISLTLISTRSCNSLEWYRVFALECSYWALSNRTKRNTNKADFQIWREREASVLPQATAWLSHTRGTMLQHCWSSVELGQSLNQRGPSNDKRWKGK